MRDPPEKREDDEEDPVRASDDADDVYPQILDDDERPDDWLDREG